MSQEVKATLRYLKIGPRKVRLVADTMRGHKVTLVVERLQVSYKKSARPLLKLLQSAIANASHNFQFPLDTLRVKAISVDGGPVTKRWMPRARGRATPLRQRTSHINLVLISEEKLEKGGKKNIEKSAKDTKIVVKKVVNNKIIKKEDKK